MAYEGNKAMVMTIHIMPRHAWSKHIAAAFFLCAAAITSSSVAQPAAKPSDAIPDFSSGQKFWVLASGTGYLKLPGDNGPGPVMGTDKYKPKIGDAVADTTNPILQPWAKKQMDDANSKVIAGGTGFVPASRCWPGGVPGILLFPGEPLAILQSPKEVAILWKRDAQVRRVYMNVPHSKNPGYSWYGESVGHYENGDTLVVDTIGLDDKGPLDRFRTPHTKQLHVVERYKLTNGGKNIEVAVHVEDPGAFTAPWNGLVKFERGYDDRTDHWEEDICAEAGEGLIVEKDAAPLPRSNKRDF